jgi:hypothetical protein
MHAEPGRKCPACLPEPLQQPLPAEYGLQLACLGDGAAIASCTLDSAAGRSEHTYKGGAWLALKHAACVTFNIHNFSAAVPHRRYHDRIIIPVYRIVDSPASQCSQIPNL